MPKDIGGAQRYSRREWGARYGRGGASNPQRSHVVAHTTVTQLLSENASPSTEKAVMRSMERFHRHNNGWNGIGYAEVVTDSGRVYEGRGPGRSLAHATGLNTSAYGFAHMGHGDRRAWSSKAWNAMRRLVAWYRREGWLRSSYRVTGHRDHSSKSCPGNQVSNSALQRHLANVSPGKEQDEDSSTDRESTAGEQEYAMERGQTDNKHFNGIPVIQDWQHFCNRFLHSTIRMVESHNMEAIDDLGGSTYRVDGIRGSNLQTDGSYGAKTQRATWAVRERAGKILGFSLPGNHARVTPTTQSLAASALTKYQMER